MCVLTISSVASLAAVTDNTNTRGTTVVNQDREDIAGITYNTTHIHTHVRMCFEYWNVIFKK